MPLSTFSMDMRNTVRRSLLNLLGEYDFSEDKLKDSIGIKPPKLTD
jgi:hypothetical protein